MHVAVAWAWFAFAVVATLVHHSGYAFVVSLEGQVRVHPHSVSAHSHTLLHAAAVSRLPPLQLHWQLRSRHITSHHIHADRLAGSMGLLDWLHGTDAAFRTSLANKKKSGKAS